MSLDLSTRGTYLAFKQLLPTREALDTGFGDLGVGVGGVVVVGHRPSGELRGKTEAGRPEDQEAARELA